MVAGKGDTETTVEHRLYQLRRYNVGTTAYTLAFWCSVRLNASV